MQQHTESPKTRKTILFFFPIFLPDKLTLPEEAISWKNFHQMHWPQLRSIFPTHTFILALNIQNTITFLGKLNSFYGTNESSSVLISKSVTLEICLPTDLILNTSAWRFCFIFHQCLFKNGLILPAPLRLSCLTPVNMREKTFTILFSLNACANNASTDEDSYHILVHVYVYTQSHRMYTESF